MNKTDRSLRNQNRAIVSVIVPLRNDELYIRECLKSLANQTYPATKMEVIVVDGDSNDKSVSIVKEFIDTYPNFVLFQNAERIVPTARNIGIAKATGQFIGMVDSHAYVGGEYIESAISILVARKDIDCVGGIMKTVGTGYWGRAISLALSSPVGVGNSAFRTDSREQLVDTLPFGVYRREVFDDIGVFDERLARNEDNDFHWRLRQRGGKILLTPKISSYYHAPGTVPKLCSQAFRNGLWNIRTMRLVKHRLSWRHFVPTAFVFALIVAASAALFGRRELLAAISLTYATIALTGAIIAGCKEGLRYLPALPLLFLLIHLSYGIGSLGGLLEVWAGSGAWQPTGTESRKSARNPRDQIRK